MCVAGKPKGGSVAAYIAPPMPVYTDPQRDQADIARRANIRGARRRVSRQRATSRQSLLRTGGDGVAIDSTAPVAAPTLLGGA